MDTNKREWLMKNCCWRSTRPKAVLAVELRAESTSEALSARNDGRQRFSAAGSDLRKSVLSAGK
jgi:hypothetical protein